MTYLFKDRGFGFVTLGSEVSGEGCGGDEREGN